MSTIIKDYKAIYNAYKEVMNSDDIYKSKMYYTTVDVTDGSLFKAKDLQSKIYDDLFKLDNKKELCGSFEVKIKLNHHDFGSYYSLEIYSVELEVDDDSSIYDVVMNYQDAGFEQVEQIISKYQV